MAKRRDPKEARRKEEELKNNLETLSKNIKSLAEDLNGNFSLLGKILQKQIEATSKNTEIQSKVVDLETKGQGVGGFFKNLLRNKTGSIFSAQRWGYEMSRLNPATRMIVEGTLGSFPRSLTANRSALASYRTSAYIANKAGISNLKAGLGGYDEQRDVTVELFNAQLKNVGKGTRDLAVNMKLLGQDDKKLIGVNKQLNSTFGMSSDKLDKFNINLDVLGKQYGVSTETLLEAVQGLKNGLDYNIMGTSQQITEAVANIAAGNRNTEQLISEFVNQLTPENFSDVIKSSYLNSDQVLDLLNTINDSNSGVVKTQNAIQQLLQSMSSSGKAVVGNMGSNKFLAQGVLHQLTPIAGLANAIVNSEKNKIEADKKNMANAGALVSTKIKESFSTMQSWVDGVLGEQKNVAEAIGKYTIGLYAVAGANVGGSIIGGITGKGITGWTMKGAKSLIGKGAIGAAAEGVAGEGGIAISTLAGGLAGAALVAGLGYVGYKFFESLTSETNAKVKELIENNTVDLNRIKAAKENIEALNGNKPDSNSIINTSVNNYDQIMLNLQKQNQELLMKQLKQLQLGNSNEMKSVNMGNR
jgi:hypothetical protein